MRDLDLIPADHLAMRVLRRRVAGFAVAMVLLLVATAAGRAWIGLRLGSERLLLETVRHEGKATADRGARLAMLRGTLAAADAQLATLRTLREGDAPEVLWRGIDDAYHARIWLDSVTYARSVRGAPAGPGGAGAALGTGAPPAAAALPTPPPGSTPATASAGDPAGPVLLQHEAEMHGYGLDPVAVTEFMRALGQRPGIAAVRLTDSGLKPFGALEVITFELTATLGQRPRETP
jgi:hypothetical protein